MKLRNTVLGMVLAFAALMGCKEDVELCDDKATIWIVNNTVCTPDIEINGDLVQADIPALDSISYEADAGAYEVEAKMALISACDDRSETINTECGGTYRFLVYP
ncbi:MAG: hypothetical protein ACPGYK_02070 [Flavobacteriales bacterium]